MQQPLKKTEANSTKSATNFSRSGVQKAQWETSNPVQDIAVGSSPSKQDALVELADLKQDPKPELSPLAGSQLDSEQQLASQAGHPGNASLDSAMNSSATEQPRHNTEETELRSPSAGPQILPTSTAEARRDDGAQDKESRPVGRLLTDVRDQSGEAKQSHTKLDASGPGGSIKALGIIMDKGNREEQTVDERGSAISSPKEVRTSRHADDIPQVTTMSRCSSCLTTKKLFQAFWHTSFTRANLWAEF